MHILFGGNVARCDGPSVGLTGGFLATYLRVSNSERRFVGFRSASSMTPATKCSKAFPSVFVRWLRCLRMPPGRGGFHIFHYPVYNADE